MALASLVSALKSSKARVRDHAAGLSGAPSTELYLLSTHSLASLPAPDIAGAVERAWARASNVLLTTKEARRQLWSDAKAQLTRASTGLRTADDQPSTSGRTQPEAAPVTQTAQPTEQQLQAMFGEDGWLRVSRDDTASELTRLEASTHSLALLHTGSTLTSWVLTLGRDCGVYSPVCAFSLVAATQSTVLTVIGNASHAFMHYANSITIEGADTMERALNRPAGQALITVSNHVSALDDPLAVASILPTDTYQRPEAVRWTLCATDRCFKYQSLVPFFTAAKVLPVQRGAGFQQPGMIAAENRLAQGDWVHIFPEGTRSRQPTQLGPIRKGVGRLVAAAAAAAPEGTPAPLVVPFVHAGMEDIMPVGSKLPSVGQKVHVIVGEPVPVADLLHAARTQSLPDEELYSAITQRVETHLRQLHARVQLMHQGHTDLATALPDMATVQPAMSGETAGVDKPSQQGMWGNRGWREGSVPVWWSAEKQREWLSTAFNMWHRGWASRMAVLEASEALPALAQ